MTEEKMAKSYASSEVSLHNSSKDIWMSMHGAVYNLTDFLSQHPGGEEILLKLAGEDGTVCFDEIGHSQEAIKLREAYKIGELEGGTSGTTTTTTATKNKKTIEADDDDWAYEAPKEKSSPHLPVFIGIGVLVYAVIFYYIM